VAISEGPIIQKDDLTTAGMYGVYLATLERAEG